MTKKLTGDAVVAKAREYIGTKWHHAGRKKGVGIDCSGLLVGVMDELGIGIVDDVNYTTGDEYERMLMHLDKYGRRLTEDDQARNGDVYVFRGERMLNHCGIYVADADTIIHCFRPLGCIEQPMGAILRKNLSVRFRYNGLDN